MYCNKCGKENRDDAKFCWSCGAALNSEPFGRNTYGNYNGGYYNGQNPYGNDPFNNPYNPYANNMPPAANPGRGFAIASLVLGILSIFICAIIAGPLGIIFGAVAKGKGSTSPMATAGIVCGIVGVVCVVLMFICCPELVFGYF